ncbi:hypothetical protein BpHYR1_041560 [Brachionus plicatilis]|uniref:Uncharacterized protein n=1 Tax=Brachionus plicatilis TaxID=10195 RepID=A0A3M7SRI6_BRAPC|nr:hypothetical protein BpHYR1_041560 [Brachionus plicatilis]
MVGKIGILFIFLISEFLGIEGTLCEYYPFHPKNKTVSYIDCENECCGGTLPVTKENLCCLTKKLWIIYPIVAICVAITFIIILIILCTKYKRPKKRVSSHQVANQVSGNLNNGFEPEMFSVQKNDLPPAYDEIVFFQKSKSTVEIKNESDQILPVLPGMICPSNDKK